MRQKAMISQPMKDMSSDDILAVRESATAFLTEQGYDVEDTFSPTMVLSLTTRKTYL